MKWFRHYHGCLSDPKFGSIARKTGQTRERAVFVWLAILESASEADTRGTVTTDIEAIADTLNCDDADVQAIWDQFIERGMIRDGVVAKWDERNPARDDSAARQRAKRDRDADVTRTPRDSDAHVTRLDTDTDTERKKDPPRAQGKSPRQHGMSEAERRVEIDFEKFWQVYPHKVGKGQARRAYRTALGKVESSEALRLAAERYAESQLSEGREQKFIAHPSTWLNGERWLDEPAKPATTDQPRPEGDPPWAKWRGYLTRKGDTATLREFKDFQASNGFDAANQRAIADAQAAGVTL